MTLRIRILLDFAAVALIIACLAYWWLDNLSHELFGTALFVLVIAHNIFNRRWYGAVKRGRWDAVRIVNAITIAGLAIAMLIMLVTSVLISRDLFAFMGGGAFAVREIHMFAAYWLLLVIALHLGTRWGVVMNVCREAFGIAGRSLMRTAVLRVIALVIVIWGAMSVAEMGFGAKLMLTYSLDMWDFTEATLGFFINYALIVGLFAVLVHYAFAVYRFLKRRASRRESRA